jgi:hypothetical protein
VCSRRRHIESGWRLMKPAPLFSAVFLMLVPFVALVLATPAATEIPEPQPQRWGLLIILRRIAIGCIAWDIAIGCIAWDIAIGLTRLRIPWDILVGLILLRITVASVVTTACTHGGEG